MPPTNLTCDRCEMVDLKDEELQSKTINFLRFPLIVGVVLIHTSFKDVVVDGVNLLQDGGGDSFPVSTTISYLFSEIIARVAVPLFFLIAGFLFFYKIKTFTTTTYGLKLKKRLKTLLVPYVFWNLLITAFFFLAQTFLPELMSGKNKFVCNYTVVDWVSILWKPANYQFWFIRDLMVVMLFSPVIYFLLKKMHLYVVIALGVFWLFNFWFYLTGFSIVAFFFFSAGAYFSIHRINFVKFMSPRLLLSAVLYIPISVAILYFRDQPWCSYLSKTSILIGIFLAVGLSSYLLKKGILGVNRFLSDSSFFIYAYHSAVLIFLIKILVKILHPHSDGMILALYVICPLVIISAGLLIYSILRKYFPRITEVVTGGR